MHEVTALRLAVVRELGAAQVNGPFAGRGQDFPGAAGVKGKTQFAGENVDGSQGENAEADGAKAAGNIADAVEDFVGGAVAAGGDDGLETVAQGLGGEAAGVSGGGGGQEDALAAGDAGWERKRLARPPWARG